MEQFKDQGDTQSGDVNINMSTVVMKELAWSQVARYLV